MKKNKVTTITGYGKLTGPAKDGVHTVDVDSGGKTTRSRRKIFSSPPAPTPRCYPD